MTIAKRLQDVIDRKKISQAEVARGVGIDSSKISKLLSGETQKPYRATLAKLADFFECNIDWLATGEGQPFSSGAYQPTPIEQNGDLVKVIFLENTYASAGSGIINYDDAPKVMTFDKTFLSVQLGITSYKNLHIITAIGDSMADKIKPGDLLFVNPGEIDIVTGAVYVFLVGEDILVKRAEKHPINGKLTLRSDNTTYAPIDLEGEDMEKVKVIGRVIGNLSKL